MNYEERRIRMASPNEVMVNDILSTRKLVYLGYVDGAESPPKWHADPVWELGMPPVYAHAESIQETGGTPIPVQVTIEPRQLDQAHAPFIRIINTIGGHNACLMCWDDEMQTHVPEQTGYNNTSLGDGTLRSAVREALGWAEAEEVEYRGPAWEDVKDG
jgi:hypothetical protein